jgi:hypothetical protein
MKGMKFGRRALKLISAIALRAVRQCLKPIGANREVIAAAIASNDLLPWRMRRWFGGPARLFRHEIPPATLRYHLGLSCPSVTGRLAGIA